MASTPPTTTYVPTVTKVATPAPDPVSDPVSEPTPTASDSCEVHVDIWDCVRAGELSPTEVEPAFLLGTNRSDTAPRFNSIDAH